MVGEVRGWEANSGGSVQQHKRLIREKTKGKSYPDVTKTKKKHNDGKNYGTASICWSPPKLSDTHMSCLGWHHVQFLTFIWVHLVAVWRGRWKKSSLSVILSLLLSLPNSIALLPPPLLSVFAQSKCIRQAGVTPVGVGCLSWVLLHISMTWPPLSPAGETFI